MLPVKNLAVSLVLALAFLPSSAVSKCLQDRYEVNGKLAGNQSGKHESVVIVILNRKGTVIHEAIAKIFSDIRFELVVNVPRPRHRGWVFSDRCEPAGDKVSIQVLNSREVLCSSRFDNHLFAYVTACGANIGDL